MPLLNFNKQPFLTDSVLPVQDNKEQDQDGNNIQWDFVADDEGVLPDEQQQAQQENNCPLIRQTQQPQEESLLITPRFTQADEMNFSASAAEATTTATSTNIVQEEEQQLQQQQQQQDPLETAEESLPVVENTNNNTARTNDDGFHPPFDEVINFTFATIDKYPLQTVVATALFMLRFYRVVSVFIISSVLASRILGNNSPWIPPPEKQGQEDQQQQGNQRLSRLRQFYAKLEHLNKVFKEKLVIFISDHLGEGRFLQHYSISSVRRCITNTKTRLDVSWTDFCNYIQRIFEEEEDQQQQQPQQQRNQSGRFLFYLCLVAGIPIVLVTLLSIDSEMNLVAAQSAAEKTVKQSETRMSKQIDSNNAVWQSKLLNMQNEMTLLKSKIVSLEEEVVQLKQHRGRTNQKWGKNEEEEEKQKHMKKRHVLAQTAKHAVKDLHEAAVDVAKQAKKHASGVVKAFSDVFQDLVNPNNMKGEESLKSQQQQQQQHETQKDSTPPNQEQKQNFPDGMMTRRLTNPTPKTVVNKGYREAKHGYEMTKQEKELQEYYQKYMEETKKHKEQAKINLPNFDQWLSEKAATIVEFFGVTFSILKTMFHLLFFSLNAFLEIVSTILGGIFSLISQMF